MSVGYVTYRAWQWFNDRARGPYRRESRYSSNDGHVSNSGQNCATARKLGASIRA